MDINWKLDYIPKSVYGNYAKIYGERVPDCKLPKSMPLPELNDFIKGRDYFSTGMMSMGRPVIELFRELYPNKCKYEAEGN